MDTRTPLGIVMETWEVEREQWSEEREKMTKTIKFLRSQNARLKRQLRRHRNKGE